MNHTLDNDYGCTRYSGVSDMTVKDGTLTEQLDRAQIPYGRVELSMGTLTAEPAYLVHYVSPKTQVPMTILVVPAAGADSWNEDYYYFPGLTAVEAQKLNWHAVYEHVRRVSWETIRSKVPVATRCSHCGKLDGVAGGGTYEDIRGRKRCSFCHELK